MRPSTIKTLKVLANLILCFYANGMATIMANEVYWSTKAPPMFDLAHQFLEYRAGADLISNFVLLVFVAAAIFMLTKFSSENYPLKFHRLLQELAYVFMGRALSIMMTFSPPPYPDAEVRCAKPIKSLFELFTRPLKMPLEIIFMSNEEILCGDSMWSGHTATMVILARFIFIAIPIEWNEWKSTAKWAMGTAMLIGIGGLLSSRMHYSSDVFIAMIVSVSAIFYVEKYENGNDINDDPHEE